MSSMKKDLVSFVARSKDEAGAALDGIYGDEAKWDFPKCKIKFHFSLDFASCGNTKLIRGDYSGVASTIELSTLIQVLLPLRGCMRVSTAHTTTALVEGGLAMGVVRSGERSRTETFDGMGLCASFKSDSVRKRAEQFIGPKVPTSFELRPPHSIDVSSDIGRYFSKLILTSFDQARAFSSSGQSKLAGMLLEETLISAASVALCPSLLDLMDSTATDVAPHVVRRIREYIEAHSNQPMALAAIAEAFGMSARSMQIAFRRYYQTTPREFLLHCRLDHARRTLVAEGAGSVTQVALESGFTDMSFFSARYKHRFAELPSETHRRVKRQKK